jgi:hypothetical protein
VRVQVRERKICTHSYCWLSKPSLLQCIKTLPLFHLAIYLSHRLYHVLLLLENASAFLLPNDKGVCSYHLSPTHFIGLGEELLRGVRILVRLTAWSNVQESFCYIFSEMPYEFTIDKEVGYIFLMLSAHIAHANHYPPSIAHVVCSQQFIA